jgi:hypothetical protein
LATHNFAGPLPLASPWILATCWGAQARTAGFLAPQVSASAAEKV